MRFLTLQNIREIERSRSGDCEPRRDSCPAGGVPRVSNTLNRFVRRIGSRILQVLVVFGPVIRAITLSVRLRMVTANPIWQM